MIKKLWIIFSLALSMEAAAGGYSDWAIPTQIEYVNDGILISGDFGNPAQCSNGNLIFISRATIGNEQFQPIMTIVLTAFTAQKEIMAYSSMCQTVSFHGKNVNESTNAVYIR